MCKVCGCTPCKCGRDIVDAVCEGCGKPYDDCTCAPLKPKKQTGGMPVKPERKTSAGKQSKKK